MRCVMACSTNVRLLSCRYGHLFGDQLDAVAERIDAAARASADNSRPARGLSIVDLRAYEASWPSPA